MTIDIDDDLLRALRARHPGMAEAEAVELAISKYETKDAAARTVALRGRIRIEDASAGLRPLDRRT